MWNLSFEPTWVCTQIHTCTYHCRKAHTFTYLYTCPVAESSVLSNEYFSQSENGHKMSEYSDLWELLEIAVLMLIFKIFLLLFEIVRLLLFSLYAFPIAQLVKNPPAMQGDSSLISGLERSAGEEIGYPFQCSWASLVAQLVKNPPAMQETWVWFLGWEDLLEKQKATHSSILARRIPRTV